MSHYIMDKPNINFMYTERLGYNKGDNFIIYDVGPINFKPSGWLNIITISTSQKWSYLLPNVLETCKEAWHIKKDTIIEYSANKIIIHYDLDIINHYIEHIIEIF